MTERLKLSSIEIRTDRQRRDLGDIEALSRDIEENGLIHAPVVYDQEGTLTLVAGERRLTAIRALFERGGSFRYGDDRFVPSADEVPVQLLSGSPEGALSPLHLETLELHENLVRRDLSWQERAQAVARLHELRTKEKGEPQPGKAGGQTVKDTGREINPDSASPHAGRNEVVETLLLRPFFEDPEVMQSETRRQALKVAERKLSERMYREKRAAREERAEEGGFVQEGAEQALGLETSSPPPTPSISSPHTILEGDCHELMLDFKTGSFKAIITDPPYGIDIGESHWGRAGAKYSDTAREAAEHYENLFQLAPSLLSRDGFLFTFCDMKMFPWLVSLCEEKGLDPWPYPLIWDRTPKGLCPVPDFGPRRCYETILMARRGIDGRTILEGRTDVLRFSLNTEHSRPGEKPPALYKELLSRVTHPGDKVLDPFAGTGPLLEAAEALSLEATLIERDAYAIEICREKQEKML